MMTETERTERMDRTTTIPRIYRTWETRLVGDTISRGLITQYCHAIAAGAHGYMMRGAETNLTPEMCVALDDKFHREVVTRDVYRLEPNHEEFGREWLASNHSKVADTFNLPDDYHGIEQVDMTDTFRWVGYHRANTPYSYSVHIVPVYAVRYFRPNGDLDTWTYHWSPYQRNLY